jgi:hypothetical protein
MAVLLLHWLREGVGELLAEALGGGLAVLLPDLGRTHIEIIFSIFINTYRPRCLVAVLLGDGPADRDLGSILLGRLLLSADKLGCFLASHVVDDDVLVLAELVLDVAALEVIGSVDVDVVGGVTDTVLDDGTKLDTVFLLYSVEVDLLFEAADQLVDVEAGPFDLGFNGASAFVVGTFTSSCLSIFGAMLGGGRV